MGAFHLSYCSGTIMKSATRHAPPWRTLRLHDWPTPMSSPSHPTRSCCREIDRSAWVTPEHGQIPWRTYSEQLLAGRVHLAARTIETDRLCHERALKWIGDVSLARLTPELLRRMTSELAGQYAAETVASSPHPPRECGSRGAVGSRCVCSTANR